MLTDEQVRALLDRDAGLAPGIRGDYSTWECNLFRRAYAAGLREAARIATAEQFADVVLDDEELAYNEGCRDVAAAIRAAAGDKP